MVGTRDGVVKVKTVKMLDGVQRRDGDLLKTLCGLPWEPLQGDPEGEVAPTVRRVQSIRVEAEQVAAPSELPPAVPAKALVRRSFYVKKDDVEKYGQTAGCPGCAAIAWEAGRGAWS